MTGTTEEYGSGPWIATFRDGPLADHEHDRIFAVGPILTDLYLMPIPGDNAAGRWARIDHSDNQEPQPPWPGQVHYTLDGVIEMAGADGEPVAYFKLVEQ